MRRGAGLGRLGGTQAQVRDHAHGQADKSHLQDAVQKTPDFWLMDGTKKVVPSRVGFIYHIERTERDLILLSLRGQGLYGWAPAIPWSRTTRRRATSPTSWRRSPPHRSTT